MKQVYLDYSATTPLDKDVLKEMLPYLKNSYANPSSIHSLGQKNRQAIDTARERAAKFLNCSVSEIVFTGSATEANNLAIKGMLKPSDHVITSRIEHPAVMGACENSGATITYIPVDNQGIISLEHLKKAIKPNTKLVSIMYANNEIGTIQPIKDIREIIGNVYLHTDAVQAANYLDCNVENLGVDMLTLSSHKIYGPKGVGLLYIKKGINITPIIHGGGQESAIRPGTENVAGIVGFGAAIQRIGYNKDLEKMRDRLIDEITKVFPDIKLNGSKSYRLANNINISVPGVEGEAMVISLDQEGIAVSTGSACSAGNLEPSHVLLALGLSKEQAHASLRITLGKYTTTKEIEYFLKVFPKVIQRLRQISGYK